MREIGRDLNPAERAEVDRWLALKEDIERAWPFNAHLYNDVDGCADAILSRFTYPWQHLRTDRAYILTPTGAVEVGPDRDMIRATARANLPDPATDCDRCSVRPPQLGLWVALVAAPRHIVALALCGLCVADVDPEEAIPVPEGKET